MSSYNIQRAKGSDKCYLGKGPHWVAERQEVLYVDILAKAVHRYVPSTGENFKVTVEGGPVSLVVPVANEPNKYLITSKRDVQVMEWDGKSSAPTNLKKLYTIDDHCKTNRIHDGKCDRKGRLWAGTMGQELAPLQVDAKKGTLYSFDLKGTVSKHFDQIDVSNGLAWSADNSILYYIDSFSYRIDAFDFNDEAGTLSNRRPAFDLKANGVDGIPDSMDIDTNGNLWIAIFEGKKVIHVDPTVGKKIGQIDCPTTNITSVAFGGPNLDILYVTSAEHLLSPEDLASQPDAGALFQVTNIGAKGLAAGAYYRGPV